MKAQINQVSTEKKSKAKRKSPSYDVDCAYSFRQIPVSEAMVEKWTQELLEWPVKNPDAKFITEFYLGIGLVESTYYSLLKKHPKLKEAHDITMRRLGERLLGRCIDGQAQWKPVHFVLHQYSEGFREADKYHAALKQSEESQSGIVVVHVPAIADMGLPTPEQRKQKAVHE